MVKGHIEKSQMEKSQIAKTQMDRSQMAKNIGLSQMAGMEGEDFPLVLSPYLRAQFPLGEGKGGGFPQLLPPHFYQPIHLHIASYVFVF
jgi:hypothetical protein